MTEPRPSVATFRVMPAEEVLPPVVPENTTYTAYWCEENIYLLGRQLLDECEGFAEKWKAFVIVVSNESQTVLICQSKRAADASWLPGYYPVLWDYHVILVIVPISPSNASDCWVYDFDSRLPMPSSIKDYTRGTFPPEISLKARYDSWFRVITLENFLDHFASDRSHMLRSSPGEPISYSSPPPTYPCIRGKRSESENNLMSAYVDMQLGELTTDREDLGGMSWEDLPYGKVIDLHVFLDMFDK